MQSKDEDLGKHNVDHTEIQIDTVPKERIMKQCGSGRKSQYTGLETYCMIRRKVELEEKKMFRLLHLSKSAKKERIRKKNKSRFVRQGKKVIMYYELLKKLEKEAEKNGKSIERPYFSGRGSL